MRSIMRKLLITLALMPCAAHAAKSISLSNATGTFSVPNSAAFRSVGSYWVDLRVHGYTLSSGTCSNLVQVAGITQFRLCDPFASGGGIFAVFPNVQTPGGVPNEDNPPNLQVIQVSQTTPAVLTLASVPPAAAVSVGSAITIWGVNDSSCAGLNGNHIVTAASELSVTVDYDGS